MDGSRFTEFPRAKRRLDLGHQAALLALGHRDGRLRGQSNLREQAEDSRQGAGCRIRRLSQTNTIEVAGRRPDGRSTSADQQPCTPGEGHAAVCRTVIFHV